MQFSVRDRTEPVLFDPVFGPWICWIRSSVRSRVGLVDRWTGPVDRIWTGGPDRAAFPPSCQQVEKCFNFLPWLAFLCLLRVLTSSHLSGSLTLYRASPQARRPSSLVLLCRPCDSSPAARHSAILCLSVSLPRSFSHARRTVEFVQLGHPTRGTGHQKQRGISLIFV